MNKISAEKKEMPREFADPHRRLPQNEDAEMALLGCILSQPDLIDELVAYPTEIFYFPARIEIFQTMRDMRAAMKPIDLITLTDALTKKELIEQVGGPATISEIFTFVPTAANWDYYLQLLRETWLARRIIVECTALAARAYGITNEEEAENLLMEVEGRLFALRDQKRLDDDILNAKVVMQRTLEKAEMAFRARGNTIGIPTGFKDLDRMTGGFHKEELIIVAARPSMGKSAFFGNMALYQLTYEKYPYAVGIFSLEMPAADVGARMLSDAANINVKRFRDGFFDHGALPKLMSMGGKIAKTKLFMDETPGISVQQFRVKARRMVSKFGVEIIYIDYLQLMRSASKRALESREKEVSEISSMLKATARELKIPIVALSQLSREAEGKEPSLSHLRESGSIEQDADVVIFPYRPDKGKESDDELPEDALAKIAKQRNGPIGKFPLRWMGKFTRFENVTEKLYSNNSEKRQGVGK